MLMSSPRWIRVAWLMGATALLASCEPSTVDMDALAQSYRDQIAQMPRTEPRTSRVRNQSTSQPELLGAREPAEIVRLSLHDALRRALANSLGIKVESYTPGITAQDVIAAEAAFDAVVFGDAQFAKLDPGTNSTVGGTGQNESRTGAVGVRKRTITGGEISANYRVNRLWSDQPFQRFNPHYENDATVELKHALLQGAGVEVNTAQIRINANNRDASQYTFRRKVIETLSAVEQAYWQVYVSRQSLAIGQELLARSERMFAMVEQRTAWDAMQVQVKQAESAVMTRRAIVIRQAADVKDAEDNLKNLLNDPALPIPRDIAILPTDEPMTEEVAVDPQQELMTGLANRPELFEARLNISNANIAKGAARNQQLPKLDLLLQWNLNGLRENFPDANEQVFHGDLQDYVVGVTFEFPIGNRAANAGYRKSQLQQEQAVTAYQKAVSDVMTQIQVALRDVQTSYREIIANREAVRAATENLSTLIARREKLSPEYLDLELNSQATQATARRALVGAIANYNIAIVKLEQAKGTLLKYDRVELNSQR